MIKLGGLICPNLNIDIIGGMDWLQSIKPTIDWDISTLTENQGGVNFHIYPDGMHHLLKDYVFVKMVEVKEEEEKGEGLNANNYKFHCIRFYNVDIKQKHNEQAQLIIQEFMDVFKEKLSELPPVRDIKHQIDLIGSIPWPAPIYKLTHKED